MGKKYLLIKREFNDIHDRFAVAGQVLIRGKLCPVNVGHMPREISQYIWFAILDNGEISGKVIFLKFGIKVLKLLGILLTQVWN